MTKPRTLLKILLVLSYIGSGLGLLGSLFVVAFRPLYEQMLAADARMKTIRLYYDVDPV